MNRISTYILLGAALCLLTLSGCVAYDGGPGYYAGGPGYPDTFGFGFYDADYPSYNHHSHDWGYWHRNEPGYHPGARYGGHYQHSAMAGHAVGGAHGGGHEGGHR